jgi:hypothetical protein
VAVEPYLNRIFLISFSAGVMHQYHRPPLLLKASAPFGATNIPMFPFRELEREYKFQNTEAAIFERLNELTYDKYGLTLEGNFTVSDPPTFELFHPNELPRNRRPFATKVTVIIYRQNGQQLVSARTSTNPTYWLLLIFLVISFIVQLFRAASALTVIGYLIIFIMIILWDRHIKNKTLERLEDVLL